MTCEDCGVKLQERNHWIVSDEHGYELHYYCMPCAVLRAERPQPLYFLHESTK